MAGIASCNGQYRAVAGMENEGRAVYRNGDGRLASFCLLYRLGRWCLALRRDALAAGSVGASTGYLGVVGEWGGGSDEDVQDGGGWAEYYVSAGAGAEPWLPPVDGWTLGRWGAGPACQVRVKMVPWVGGSRVWVWRDSMADADADADADAAEEEGTDTAEGWGSSEEDDRWEEESEGCPTDGAPHGEDAMFSTGMDPVREGAGAMSRLLPRLRLGQGAGAGASTGSGRGTSGVRGAGEWRTGGRGQWRLGTVEETYVDDEGRPACAVTLDLPPEIDECGEYGSEAPAVAGAHRRTPGRRMGQGEGQGGGQTSGYAC